jgi:ribosomal protein S12 methylthiotransferase
MGVFMYSREDGTGACDYPGQVPFKVKASRFDELMRIQQRVSEKTNSKFLGKTIDVLIDEIAKDKKEPALGRTEFDAPEVDGQVFVRGRGLKPGDMLKVKIADTLEYDLAGEAV